jgi:glycine oxidase
MPCKSNKDVEASTSFGAVQETPGSPDAIVVGAGLIGSAIAWLLARAGRSVHLIDAGTLGGEASSAGAGMLAPGGEYKEPSAHAHFAIESLAMYPAFVQQLESDSGLQIDFRNCGAIELAFVAADWSELRRQAGVQRRFGIAVDPICISALGALVPGLETKELRGALFYPKDCCVDPGHLLRALRIACERHSVKILEGFPVEGIQLHQDRVGVRAGQYRTIARHVVLAAGAWSSGIPITASGSAIKIPRSVPVRGHLVGYSLPANSLRPIVRHRDHYLVQRKGGFTVAGASSEWCEFDRSLNPQQVRSIQDGVSLFYPVVRTLEPTRQWFGFRPGIEHSGPAIRRITCTNLWLAYGHYRNGILLTPATAQLVASEILRSGNRTQASAPARLKQTSLASEESVTGTLDVPNGDVPTFPRTT